MPPETAHPRWLAAAHKADGRPLAELSLQKWNSAAMAGFAGMAQGAWGVYSHLSSLEARAAFAVVVSTAIGRASAVVTAMSEQKLDFLPALKESLTDPVGIALDVVASGGSYAAAVANNTRQLRNTLSPEMLALAQRQSKDVGAAVLHLGEVKELLMEGKELFKGISAGFVDLIAQLGAGRSQAEAVRWQIANDLRVPAFASRVIEWGDELLKKLPYTELYRDGRIRNVINQFSKGLVALACDAALALRAEAQRVAGVAGHMLSNTKLPELGSAVAKLDAEIASGAHQNGSHWIKHLRGYRDTVVQTITTGLDMASSLTLHSIHGANATRESAVTALYHYKNILTNDVLQALPAELKSMRINEVEAMKKVIDVRFPQNTLH